MPQTLLARHAAAQRLFGERVEAVAQDQWDAPTPCTQWSVRDLVDHVTGEQLWVPPLVAEGRTVEELGDGFAVDVLGTDPAAAWARASAAAHAAFSTPGALDRSVPLSHGSALGSAYCADLITDCVVHAWDLARGIGADDRLPDDLVEFCLKRVMPYAGTLSAGGMFAEQREIQPGANAQARLLAVTGRQG